MKLSFFIINMNLGGTEKAFLSFAEELLKQDVEIELILLEKKGELLKEIPHTISIKELDYNKIKYLFENSPINNLKELLKKQQWVLFVQYLFYRIVLIKFFNKKFPFYNWLSSLMLTSEIHTTDVAIAYAGPHELISYLVSEKITARKKIQWIHFDISKVGFDEKFYKILSCSFNKIFTVSNFVKQQLLRNNQLSKDKVAVFYNCLPVAVLNEKATVGERFTDDFIGLRIVTVGRLTTEKGIDIALKSAKLLKNKKIKFRWYFIGDGVQKNNLINSSINMDLENEVVFLGKKENPYNYLNNCDIYVQPSRHEGFGITVSEAKFFNKPIVASNIPGFNEQIIHKKTGYICKGIAEQDILEGIEYFLNASNRKCIISNLAKNQNENKTNVMEFLKLLN